MLKVSQQEQLEDLCHALCKIANSITPIDASPGVDLMGGYVASLTEAVMGHTKAMLSVATALAEISNSIENVAFQFERFVDRQDTHN